MQEDWINQNINNNALDLLNIEIEKLINKNLIHKINYAKLTNQKLVDVVSCSDKQRILK